MEVALQDTSFTKVCPRCGERLFRDMHVCYGCLYDFDHPQPIETPPDLGVPETIDDVPGPYCEGTEDEGAADACPPSDGGVSDPDSTLSWEADSYGEEDGTDSGYAVRVSTPAMDAAIPVGEEGLSIGRAPSNDIVLHIRSVSRHHLRLMPDAGGILVHDLGATNPARLRGRALVGCALAAPGETFEVCGVTFEVGRRAAT